MYACPFITKDLMRHGNRWIDFVTTKGYFNFHVHVLWIAITLLKKNWATNAQPESLRYRLQHKDSKLFISMFINRTSAEKQATKPNQEHGRC